MKRWVYILCVFFPFLVGAQGQIKFENVSTENGLSNNYIRCIFQDSFGFIWIGTNEGLNRYNGKDFLILKKELKSYFVTSIIETANKNIWIGTIKGISIFNPFQNKVSELPYKLPFDNQYIYSIIHASTNHILISAQSGVYDLNTENYTFKKIKISYLPLKQIIKSNNLVYFVSQNKICEYNLTTQKRKELFTVNDNLAKITLHLLSNNELYFSIQNAGVYKLSVLNSSFISYSEKDLSTINSLIINDKDIWISTNNGIIILDTLFKKKGGISDSDKQFSFKGKNILVLYADSKKNIWCGTEYNGVNILYNSKKKFSHYYNQINNYASLPDNQVNAIVELNAHTFLIGSPTGLSIFDNEHHSFKRIDHFNIEVISIVKINNYGVLIGTKEEGLYFLNEKSLKITKINEIPNITIYKIIHDIDGFIWLGTWSKGLIRYNTINRSIKFFPINKNNDENAIYDITLRNNELWLATYGEGVIKITDRFSNIPTLKYYKTNVKNKNSIPSNEVLSLFKTSENKLWFGIAGIGIVEFNDNTEEFLKIKNSKGSYFDCAIQFYEDSEHNVWFNNKGITVFNLKTKESRIFGVEDGIQSEYFNMNAGCNASSGLIFMGGINGFNTFYPKNTIANSKSECIPTISSLYLFNKEVVSNAKYDDVLILNKPISFVDTIVLSYKHSMIQLNVAALYVKNPSKLRYSYQMEGYNDLWFELQKGQNSISFSNIKHGVYTLKIRCTDESENWSVIEKKVVIKIIPPYWKTSWFYSIIIIIFVVILIFYIKMREFNLVKEKRKLESKVKERTQEIIQQKEELQIQSDLLIINNKELSRKNQQITDSITYAKRIQDAILPSVEVLQSFVPNSFIFFNPKDIVSGDFYWFYEHNNTFYIAVADCTGHGVPGAFMSMIGTTLLNDIINDNVSQKPSEILDKLNQGVVKAFKQQEMENRFSQDDGMDITLCCIDKNKQTIQISCANHVVYHLYNNTLESIQGDYNSIGGSDSTIDEKGFTNFEFRFTPGSRFYLMSDGFQDQFGGEFNKKFTAKKLRELLLETQSISMEEQYNVIKSAFESWKGNYKQIDDVLVLGFEL